MSASWMKRWPWSATRMMPDELLTMARHRCAGSGFHRGGLRLAFGCARLPAVVRRRAARSDRGCAAGPAPCRAHQRAAGQAVRRAVSDPGAGRRRRGRRCGAGPRGARRDPQQLGPILRLADRGGRAAGGGAGGGMAAGDAADVLGGPAQPGCRGARFAGAGPGQRLRAGVAEDGAQTVVGAAGHLGFATGAGAVQSHAGRGGGGPGRGAGQQPGGGGHRTQRRQDPRDCTGLSESVGGQWICALARPRDDQCARGGRREQRHRGGQRQPL